MNRNIFGLRQRTSFGNFQSGRAGGLRVDWSHPISKDLSYCRVLDSFAPYPLFTRAPQVESINNGGVIRSSAGGIGWGGTNGGSNPCFFNSSNKFAIADNTTVFAFVRQDWSSTDGLVHWIWTCGQNNGDTVREIMMGKYSTNNWYLGCYDGSTATERRVITAATGIASAGQDYVVGFTCVLGGQTTAYSKGAVVGTPTTSPVAPYNTAHDYWVIGALGVYATTSWGSSDNSIIHWFAIWDRILNASEIALISQQPYCFFTSEAARMMPGLAGPDFGPRTMLGQAVQRSTFY